MIINSLSYTQLFAIFRQYAKTHPDLGMTIDEFGELLVAECYVRNIDTTKRHNYRVF